MTFPKARVVVFACLFLGWLGFLLYLVIDSPTVLLSRPQFLVAQLYIVADVGGGPADPIVIDEVLWSADPGDERLVGKQVRIPGVAELKNGYVGPGKYLLPLMKTATGSLLVAPLPRTAQAPEIRVYPWTPELRGQVEEIVQSRR